MVDAVLFKTVVLGKVHSHLLRSMIGVEFACMVGFGVVYSVLGILSAVEYLLLYINT
jgi:hypothetical protein